MSTPVIDKSWIAKRYKPNHSALHDPAWRALGNAYQELTAKRTGRRGIVVDIAPNAGQGSPGCFIPALSRIEVDGGLLPVRPEQLDTGNDAHFAALAAMHGVWAHEAGHAKHTTWGSKSERERRVEDAMALLEEIRMEAQTIRSSPRDRRWLRAASEQLILPGVKDSLADRSLAAAAHAATLTVGRVAAGTLDDADVAEIETALQAIFEPQMLASLQAIWQDTVMVADNDDDALEAVAARFCDLVPADPVDMDALAALIGAIAGAAEGVAVEAVEELHADPSATQIEVVVRDAKQEIDDQNGSNGSGLGAARGGAIQIGLRAPTPIERRERNELAKKLKLARWRDRAVDDRLRRDPPGRLRTRQAVQASAQRAMGKPVTATPWRKRVRTQVEQPKLALGILVDTSGSMGGTENELSATLWVLANAVADVGGESSAAAFGDSCKKIVESRKPPAQVLAIGTSGGTGYVPQALDYVSEDLQLQKADKQRIVVIISDGAWSSKPEVKRRVATLRSLGVKVILVGIGSAPQGTGETVTCVLRSAAEIAKVIGLACEEALKAA